MKTTHSGSQILSRGPGSHVLISIFSLYFICRASTSTLQPSFQPLNTNSFLTSPLNIQDVRPTTVHSPHPLYRQDDIRHSRLHNTLSRSLHPNIHISTRQSPRNLLLPIHYPRFRHPRVLVSTRSSDNHIRNPEILQQRIGSRTCFEHRGLLPE